MLHLYNHIYSLSNFLLKNKELVKLYVYVNETFSIYYIQNSLAISPRNYFNQKKKIISLTAKIRKF